MKQNSVETGFTNAGAAAWIPPTATFASAPPSPATGSVYLFTDALTPGANVGGGTSLSTCRWSGTAWVSAGAGPATTIQDEGTPLTQRASLNFVGAGVVATDDSANGRTVVTIPGGYADPLTTKGDLLARSASATTRMAVGTVANQTLLVDSAQALGIKWATMTAAMITNAVDQTGSYTNPAWIVSIPWSKVTGAPSVSSYQTPWLSDIDGAGFTLKNAGRIGVGVSVPLSTLHARAGVSGASGPVNADTVAFLEHSSNAYLEVVAGSAKQAGVLLGGNGVTNAAQLMNQWDGTNLFLNLTANTVGSYVIVSTAGVERMRITATGTVSVKRGADNTDAITISGVDNNKYMILQSAPTYGTIQHWNGSGFGNVAIVPNGGYVGIGMSGPSYQLQLSTDAAAKPGTSAWTVASDERLKRNIQPFAEGLATLLQFDPLAYEYNGLDGTPEGMKAVGLSAQQAMNIYPPMVKFHSGVIAEKAVTILDLNNSDLTWMMVNAFKQVDLRLKALEGKP